MQKTSEQKLALSTSMIQLRSMTFTINPLCLPSVRRCYEHVFAVNLHTLLCCLIVGAHCSVYWVDHIPVLFKLRTHQLIIVLAIGEKKCSSESLAKFRFSKSISFKSHASFSEVAALKQRTSFATAENDDTPSS